MNTVLWMIQIVLAAIFLIHGRLMLSPSPAMTSRPGMDYVLAIPPAFRRIVGVVEILASIGLVLPGLLSVLPWLTPLAAAGLVLVMLGAIVMHIRRREYTNIIFNVVLLILAAVVAYGRFVVVPL